MVFSRSNQFTHICDKRMTNPASVHPDGKQASNQHTINHQLVEDEEVMR